MSDVLQDLRSTRRAARTLLDAMERAEREAVKRREIAELSRALNGAIWKDRATQADDSADAAPRPSALCRVPDPAFWSKHRGLQLVGRIRRVK